MCYTPCMPMDVENSSDDRQRGKMYGLDSMLKRVSRGEITHQEFKTYARSLEASAPVQKTTGTWVTRKRYHGQPKAIK